MLFIYTVLLFYLSWLFPEYLSWKLLLLMLPPFIFMRERVRGAIRMILTVLLLISFMYASAMTGVWTSIPKESVSRITVRVISDSMTKKNRRSGFTGKLLYASDRSGTYLSASGVLYIMSDATSLHRGDVVTLSGSFGDDGDIFFSRGMNIRQKARGYVMRSRAGDAMRQRLGKLSEDARELSLLLLIGEGDDPTYFLSEKAREKGVSHVFALSGMHLSILCSFMMPFLSTVLGRKLAKKTAVLPLAFFTYTSGWRPSLVRAFIFRTVRTWSDTEDDTAFALTVCIHALFFPETLLSTGSMFSYMSVAALFFLVPRLDDALKDAMGFRPTVLTTSLSCLIVTAPYALRLFGSWSLSSLLFSPVMSALVTLYMALSIIYLMFPVFPTVMEHAFLSMEWVLTREWGIWKVGDLTPWFWMVVISSALIAAGKVVKTERNLYAESDVEPQL